MEINKDRKAVEAIVPSVSKTRIDYKIPVTEFFMYDGLGSVVMLTDVLGNPTQMYQYDVFGGTQTLKRDPFNKYRFVGLAQDDSLGLTYMNARWYDAGVGRFIGRDPESGYGDLPESLDRYVYAMNNPVNTVDVTGLDSVPSLKSVEIEGSVFGESSPERAFHENKEPSVTRLWADLTKDEKVTYVAGQMKEAGFPKTAERIERLQREGRLSSSWWIELWGRSGETDPLAGKVRVGRRQYGDPLALADTLAHESVHYRQACEGTEEAKQKARKDLRRGKVDAYENEAYRFQEEVRSRLNSLEYVPPYQRGKLKALWGSRPHPLDR